MQLNLPTIVKETWLSSCQMTAGSATSLYNNHIITLYMAAWISWMDLCAVVPEIETQLTPIDLCQRRHPVSAHTTFFLVLREQLPT